ncbi:transglutaminase-like domain-containing protein [Allorhodopirellula solitaria]|uniref:Transglutaminase-like superfamily protein n=1 Tax=Allorhodopirellula solitaria TaxID=2527987 RepID=A0A5C5XXJ3_9BACT|nr:transglutaminase-like domain-containing protein [Allorhodopirellula solitaria]TWT66625.1 Transglutaminase-like superfamily protein [Allorhodopirellula solitaria]
MTTITDSDGRRFGRANWSVIVLLGAWIGGFAGCDVPDRHDIGIFREPAAWEVADSSSQDRGQLEPSGLSGGSAADSSPPDTWHLWYLHHVPPTGVVGGVDMQSQRVGSVGAEDQIQVTLHERMLASSTLTEVAPPGAWRSNEFEYLTGSDQTFWYALDGGLLRAESQFRFGPIEQRRSVEVEEDQVRFHLDGPVRRTSKTVPHQGKLAGPLAVYRSLLGNPLAAEKMREATIVLPSQESTAELQIQGQPQALARRMTKQGIEMDSLHEAIVLVSIDSSQQRQQFYWYDDEGIVQTVHTSGDPRFTYRCDEDQYDEMAKPINDQQHPVVVEVPGKEMKPGTLSLLALDVEQSPHSLASESSTWNGISPAPRQYVQRIDASHQRVIMAGPAVSVAKLPAQSPRYDSRVREADLETTPVLNYRSAGVRKVLEVAGSMIGLDDEERALALNKTVHSLLSWVPLSEGIRSAGSIAQSSLADSTEHSILLIAMLRAKHIPARLTTGLRYLPLQSDPQLGAEESAAKTPSTHRFGYHAWVIAKTGQEWISLDPTTGEPTGPDCLSLDVTDLAKVDPHGFVQRYLAILRSLRLSVSACVVES